MPSSRPMPADVSVVPDASAEAGTFEDARLTAAAGTEPSAALTRIAQAALDALPGLVGLAFAHPSAEHPCYVTVPPERPVEARHRGLVVEVPCCETGLEITAWSSPTGGPPVAARELAPYAWAATAALAHVHEMAAVLTERNQLREALTSRATIDQAKGMIMISTGCTADQAFARLVLLSSTRNVRLREVAGEIVCDGIAFAQRARQR